MQRIRQYIPFLASAIGLVLLIVIYYPYCKYYIDPDATAYLTISQHYADGDWRYAINGYWSPWSCWLTALLIKMGTTAIGGAIIANSIAAVLLVWVTQSFFRKYSVRVAWQWMLCAAMAVFLSYAVYWQNFDDLWECFFLLYALRIMASHKFRHTPAYWVGAGVLGALAYFAKAYAFSFFIISTLAIVFYNTRAWRKANRVECLKISIIIIGTMLLVSSPWLYALHHKYGIWTTGSAGRLNMSWYLVGHPYWQADIQYLLPPPNTHAVSYWEDPLMVNGQTPMFWHSADLFLKQMMKLVQNSFKFTISSLQIGVGFLAVWVYMVWLLLFRKQRRQKFRAYYPIIIPFILFPLPFFLINFEARYIWYMLPISIVLGVAIIKKNRLLNKGWVMALFAISYVVWPVYGISKMWNVGKQEYELAQKLRQEDIIGRYASNVIFGKPEAVAMQRIAYFTGNAYYIMHKAPKSFQELLPELRKYGIKYYCYYPKHNPDWKIVDENDKPLDTAYTQLDMILYHLQEAN
ncbi:hypothetical protein CAP35_00070 [Chitinophagaceae bacterium IBVUCB1]|nr:hypothetical protein CAP35_00070 [Chitinophagaceae bacterium IBVUCB1]